MQVEPLVDYATPMMCIEKMLRDMHNLLLKNKFEEAIELSLAITAEAKLLNNTLVLMREKQR